MDKKIKTKDVIFILEFIRDMLSSLVRSIDKLIITIGDKI